MGASLFGPVKDWQSATLYKGTKAGKTQMWQVRTEGANIITTHGQVDGAQQTTSKRAVGKNAGKANATTPQEQAIAEARAMFIKKRDKGYTEHQQLASVIRISPMLAHSFPEHHTKITFPASAQPKLDGVRCLAYWENGLLHLMSRGGKSYHLPHITEELQRILPTGHILDGEIYQHGKSFQSISSLVKRLQPETGDLKFHAYDYINPERSAAHQIWRGRRLFLAEFFKKRKPEHLVQVPSSLCLNKEHAYDLMQRFILQGYEGAIIRDDHAPYLFGHRSHGLLKLKTFLDEEFTVVGYTEGVGKHEGHIIWTCITDEGEEFNVTPKGTSEDRQQWYREARSYLGKRLMVRYFEKYESGVPRFPIGVGIREDGL